MKFGLFFINEQPPWLSGREVMLQSLEQCKAADELGFEALWFGEHHFAPYGTMADTMVFAGAASQVTSRIALGTAVIVPAFQHPARVAEQVAMLDLLSDGRFWLGMGRGYQQREFQGFGIPQSESQARFRESVTIINGLLTNDRFTHHGEFWNIDDLSITPSPRDNVPIYIAVSQTPESFEWAVKSGFGVMVGNPYASDANSGGSHAMYLAARREEIEHNTGQLPGDAWGLLNNVFVQENSQQARAIYEQTWKIGNEYMDKWARVVEEGSSLPEDYRHYEGFLDNIRNARYDDIWQFPGTMIGSPAEIVDRIHQLWEKESRLDKYILWMNRGGAIAQPELLRSMELFATEVMPHVAELVDTEVANLGGKS
jgi:alkanesulfonate monooxygenase SsuD/methylene tetrahydromethanopterin reductase-like flavin-dependent oxidoreductase (luciferase family)